MGIIKNQRSAKPVSLSIFTVNPFFKSIASQEKYVRDSDSPYLEGGYAASNVDYGYGY